MVSLHFYSFYFKDNSSFEQRPSSPEGEDDSSAQHTEVDSGINLNGSTSPSTRTSDNAAGLKVSPESTKSIPELQDPNNTAASTSGHTLGEEKLQADAADS